MREQRLLAAETTIPAVVWIVTLVGGALTIAFGSFLGVPSLGMHLAMSATLAISGVLVVILIIALTATHSAATFGYRHCRSPRSAQIEASATQP